MLGDASSAGDKHLCAVDDPAVATVAGRLLERHRGCRANFKRRETLEA